ncbi:hypothetical protein [Streptomyces sp. 6N223]|uniref:hypothetical protein n=1 Tax=Streptomyces sp. 6N223 TaxID=3457412 RepID=UPI003FD45329
MPGGRRSRIGRRGSERPPTPVVTAAHSPYAASSRPRLPIHLRPDPLRRIWLAPWVQGGALGRPLLSLCGLVPMALLLPIGPDLHALARDSPRTPPATGWEGRLGEWAEHDAWRAPLTLLLLTALAGLAYLRGRLQRHSEREARAWAAAGACYWLLWSLAVVLNLAWVWGIGAGVETTGTPATLGWAIVAWLALCANALAAPYATVAALVRLRRALTGDVARPVAG